MQTSRRLLHPTALALYLLLTLGMTWPLLRVFGEAIPGDGFDGWQNYWNLWWMKVALVDRVQSPYFTDLLFHPTGVGLLFHTLNPFNGLVTLPIQLSGGLFPAYNSVVLLSWVLGGYGMFLLVRWLLAAAHVGERSRGISGLRALLHPLALAPFLAGAIFTFAPFHMAHLLGHMQLMSLEWIPFYVLYLLRGLARVRAGQPWRRDALWAGLFLVLVGLCDWYYVLYLLIFTGSTLLLGMVQPSWLPSGGAPGPCSSGARLRLFLPPLVAGALFAVVLSPVLVPMVQEALRYRFMERPASDLYILSATLVDFLIPNRLHPLFRPESFAWPGNQIAPVSERTLAIGYTALLLAGWAGLRRWSRSRFWLWTAGLFLLLALGPAFELFRLDWNDVPTADPGPSWTPYGVLNRLVPFMRISRSVSRMALMVQFGVAVAAAWGMAHAMRGRARSGLGGILALALVLFEFWVAPFPISPPDTPTFYAGLREAPERLAVLNLPMNFDRPGYLLYQTVHGKPLTVAYISRDDPRTYTERIPVLQHFRHLGPDILDVDPVTVAPTVFRDLEVGWVVLDRYKMPGGREREYTTQLAQAIFAGQLPIYQDDRLTVYRVATPARPRAYPLLGPEGWGPLRTDGDGPYRAIGTGPAVLEIRHLQGPSAVQITVRGTSGDRLLVELPGVARPQAFPMDGSPQTVEILLAPSMAPSGPGSVALTLRAAQGPLAVMAVRVVPMAAQE